DGVDMEEFIGQARLLMGTLGYDLFEPGVPPAESVAGVRAPLPEFSYAGEGFDATCVVDLEAGQFIVKANSRARKQEAAALQATYKNLRSQLKDSGVIIDEGDELKFTQDYAFTAISAAAQ